MARKGRKKGGKGKKKSVWNQRGPLAMFTFADILKVVFMAIITGLGLAFFNALDLTPTIMAIVLVLLFFGLIIATIIMNYAKAKMK